MHLGKISEVGKHQTSTTDSWVTDVRVDIGNLGTQYVRFKLDTGAAVYVVHSMLEKGCARRTEGCLVPFVRH